MHPNEMWFPVDGSKSVVGRFVDTEIEVTQADGSKRIFKRPALEAAVAGKTSTDVSFQLVKDHEKAKIVARCPLGWAHYEKLKAAPPPVEAVPLLSDLGMKGTPIEAGALACSWNNDRITWFKSQGIYTCEQVAELSDAVCQSMGKGAVGWRKKANAFLALQKSNAA